MVRAFHFVFSAYGFWLPNDPRGSWSDVVREFDLLAFGEATKTSTTRSVAATNHDHSLRRAAKVALRYTPVRFTGEQARAIADGFRGECGDSGYRVYALAVLQDHAHVLMSWHANHVDRIAAQLKAGATRELSRQQLHPMPQVNGRRPSPWSRNHWCPFVREAERVPKVIRYVEQNPIKAGLPPQKWKWTIPWDDATSRGAS